MIKNKLKTLSLVMIFGFASCGAPQQDTRPIKKTLNKNNNQSDTNSGDINSIDSEANDPSSDNQNNGGQDDSSMSSCRDLQTQFASSTTSTGKAAVPLLGAINFSLNIDAKVELQASERGGRVGIDGIVKSAQPGLAKGLADNAIGAYKDPLQLTFASMTEQKKLAGYQGLDCVVAAVKSIRNNKMEFTYDPPIPFIALKGASDSANLTRTFPNIKARIVRHFESVARPGVYTGSATLTKSGGSVKIRFNFGQTKPSMYATPVSAIEYVYNGKQIDAFNATIFVSDNSTTELRLGKK